MRWSSRWDTIRKDWLHIYARDHWFVLILSTIFYVKPLLRSRFTKPCRRWRRVSSPWLGIVQTDYLHIKCGTIWLITPRIQPMTRKTKVGRFMFAGISTKCPNASLGGTSHRQPVERAPDKVTVPSSHLLPRPLPLLIRARNPLACSRCSAWLGSALASSVLLSYTRFGSVVMCLDLFTPVLGLTVSRHWLHRCHLPGLPPLRGDCRRWQPPQAPAELLPQTTEGIRRP